MAKTKSKTHAWFIARRGSYLPASLIGLIIYLVYVAYIAALLGGWYVDGHRIWYLLVYVIPLSTAAAILTQFVASKHSR